MVSLYQMKPAFVNRLRPYAAQLVARGVTANQVTLAALALSALAGLIVASGPGQSWLLLIYPPVLFARMALNAIDGIMAREHDQESRLGAVLNELCDMLSDAALYLPLALVPGLSGSLVVLVVAIALIGESAGILAQALGAGRRFDGPLGKSDRAFVFGALALLLGFGVPGGWWSDLVLLAMLGAAMITLYRRARAALDGAVA